MTDTPGSTEVNPHHNIHCLLTPSMPCGGLRCPLLDLTISVFQEGAPPHLDFWMSAGFVPHAGNCSSLSADDQSTYLTVTL